jgi:hypothetical protein
MAAKNSTAPTSLNDGEYFCMRNSIIWTFHIITAFKQYYNAENCRRL